MIRRYQRFLAVTLSAVMTVLPATALAAGGTPETDLTHAVAKAIAAHRSDPAEIAEAIAKYLSKDVKNGTIT